MTRIRLLPVTTCAVLLVCAATALAEDDALRDVAARAGPVDFAKDVEPILKRECHTCHGPGDASGGLNLTSRKMADYGGDSGGTILGGPLTENVLWQRVATKDADYRMPKGGRLSDDELGVLRAWIEQGSTWPAVTTPKGRASSDWPAPLDVLKLTVKKHPVLWVVLLLVLLAAVRLQAMRKADHPFTARRGRTLYAALGWIRVEHVLLVFLGVAALDLMAITRRQVARAEALTDHVALERAENPVYTYFFGDPPKPYRPPVEKTVDATYWRGNCERAPHLFNGGRYRTGTLHLSLCDAERNPVRIGDAVPAGGLFVRFDIKRSPHTADTMYAEAQMSRVFASPTWYTGRIRRLAEPPVVLDVIKKDWSWSALLPVAQSGDGTHTQLWYVYQNLRQDGVPFTPKVHLGITYELMITDGKVAEGSDLWMGNLFWNVTMEPPPRPYQLPLAEWLHHEPIPVIPDGHAHHEARGGG